MPPFDKVAIGQRIKQARTELGFTQKVFADLLSEFLQSSKGVSYGFLSQVETGKYKPSAELLYAMQAFFNINLYWIFHGLGDVFISTEKLLPEDENHPQRIAYRSVFLLMNISDLIFYGKYATNKIKDLNVRLVTVLFELKLKNPVLFDFFLHGNDNSDIFDTLEKNQKRLYLLDEAEREALLSGFLLDKTDGETIKCPPRKKK